MCSVRLGVYLFACALACRARFLWAPLRSQPEPGIEFLNSDLCPHTLQTPVLVGPFGLSMTQWCSQLET